MRRTSYHGHGSRTGRRPDPWFWAQAVVLTAVAGMAVTTASGAGQSAVPTPRRIVSLVPAVTEMLFAIGAGPIVVGVSSFDRYPAEARTRPSVGALIDPDFERIATLRPDLVITYGSQTDLLTRLERTAVPAYIYRHAGLADVTVTLRELGRRVGRQAAADGLADRIDRELAQVRASVAGRSRPGTVLVFGREPGTLRGMYASGGIGFLHDMLELAGGRNLFADVARENLQVSSEQLLSRAPEVVLEVRSSDDWDTDRVRRERDAWRVLPSVPAVRTGRIYILADDKLTIPGPRVAETARMFAEALHQAR